MKNALFATAETVVVALVAYYFIEWDWLKNHVIAKPEIVVLPLIATFLLGKFTGLRLSEYFKFRALLREDAQE